MYSSYKTTYGQDHERGASCEEALPVPLQRLEKEKQRAVSVRPTRSLSRCWRRSRRRSRSQRFNVVSLANIVMTVDTRSLRPQRKPKTPKRGRGRRPVARRMRDGNGGGDDGGNDDDDGGASLSHSVLSNELNLVCLWPSERGRERGSDHVCVCVCVAGHTYMVCY